MNQLDVMAEEVTRVDDMTVLPVSVAAGPVLVAIDLSANSEKVLLWACDYAEQTGASVKILHVIHDPAEKPGKYRSENGDLHEPMADVAERQLADFLADVRERHPELTNLSEAKSHCIPGLPAGTILDMAEKHGARLLVLGSHGRDGLARALLGSTAEKVVRQSFVPVTIVKASAG